MSGPKNVSPSSPLLPLPLPVPVLSSESINNFDDKKVPSSELISVDVIEDDFDSGPFSLKSLQQHWEKSMAKRGLNKITTTTSERSKSGKVNDFTHDASKKDKRLVDLELQRKCRMSQQNRELYQIENGDMQNLPGFWLLSDLFWEDDLGLKITSGSVVITKDGNTNMIGISIGGGAPNCPCLYIVQIFDNTPASRDGTLQSGDEITGVNNVSVKGKTKVEVAKMIQSIKNEVTISYNKLHADAAQGKSLDIILKKVKHRLVENMSSATADALGLSRAILCNDNLVKKLTDLQRTEVMYRGLVEHTQRLLKAYLELLRVVKLFGETFAVIGVREPQPRASLAFTQFADYHRNMEKRGVDMVKKLKPILSDLGTYLHKAIPDTKLTIGKYADAKFEYLSFCLKVKEMDDEEFNYASVQEPLYRVETGNYEYRLVLRCRQEARLRFGQLRSDVQVKLELLDNKHVQDVATQLQKLSKGLAEFYEDLHELSKENANLFPVEVDLTDNAFIYEKSFEILPPDETSADEN